VKKRSCPVLRYAMMETFQIPPALKEEWGILTGEAVRTVIQKTATSTTTVHHDGFTFIHDCRLEFPLS